MSNDIIYITGFIIFFFGLSLVLKNSSKFLYFIYTFLSTVFHELAHFIIGLILFANPTYFSLIPKKTEEGYTLGFVEFNRLNSFNALPISLAPLILIFIAYLTFNQFYGSMNIVLLSFLLFLLLNGSIPSSQDFSIVFEYKLGIILYLCLVSLFIYIYFFGGNINEIKNIFNTVINNNFIQ